MDRVIYQLTERDIKKAQEKEAQRRRELEEIEKRRDDKRYWKRRRTTYGLAKRDLCGHALAGDVDWYLGRGQGILDKMSGLGYSEERLSSAYNSGYYDGYHFSYTEMKGYIQNNPNFRFVDPNTLCNAEVGDIILSSASANVITSVTASDIEIGGVA